MSYFVCYAEMSDRKIISFPFLKKSFLLIDNFNSKIHDLSKDEFNLKNIQAVK